MWFEDFGHSVEWVVGAVIDGWCGWWSGHFWVCDGEDGYVEWVVSCGWYEAAELVTGGAQVSDGDVDEVSVVVFPFGCFDVAVVEFEQVRFCVALNADALVVLFGEEVEVEIDYVIG